MCKFGYSFPFFLLTVTKKLKEIFATVHDTLIDFAVECSGCDEERATFFLSSMTPQDSDAYLPKGLGSYYEIEITKPSVATQTGAFISVLPGSPVKYGKKKCDLTTHKISSNVVARQLENESIEISCQINTKENTENISHNDKRSDIIDAIEVTYVEVATWTKEDGIIHPPTKAVLAQGSDPKNKLTDRLNIIG